MRRLCADYAWDFDSFSGKDSNAFGQKRVRPPASHYKKPDEAVRHYGLHHEADLVHVGGNQYPGVARTALALTKDVPGPVGGYAFSKFTSENPPHSVFLPGGAVCLAQFFEELNAFCLY
jgi:hypothetical protein